MGALMKNNIKFLGLFLAALVLLPSCMRIPTYRSQPLRSASADFTYRGIENNVILQAKRLSEGDIQQIFGEQGQELSKSLDVIYLSAHNLSSISYVFPVASIDLAMVPYKDVAEVMKTNTHRGFADGIVCAGATCATVYPAALSLMLSGPIAIVYGGFASGAIIGGLSLAYFGKSIKSMIMNKRLTKDIEAKIFDKAIKLNSGEQYDGLIFVKKQDYTPTFSVKMHEQDIIDSTITFDVELRKNTH
jgi:hypothetical protein